MSKPFFVRSLTLPLAALFGVAMAASPSSANLIVNGDFATMVPSNGTGGGWSSNNIDAIGGWYGGVGVPGPSFRINTAPGGEPTIAQEVGGLTIGQDYLISGDYALGFGGGQPDDSFQVRVDSTTILSLGPDPLHDPNGGNFPFAPFQVSFTATATTHAIIFAAQVGGSDHDYFIDNITMVPEPTTAALMASGLALLAARRRCSPS